MSVWGGVLCWRWKGGPGRYLVVRLPWGRGGWSEGVGRVMRGSPPCRDPQQENIKHRQ